MKWGSLFRALAFFVGSMIRAVTFEVELDVNNVRLTLKEENCKECKTLWVFN